MNKENLLDRAKRWKKRSEKLPIYEYPTEMQPEILGISYELLKKLCETDGITTYKATQALEMAKGIIEAESLHDAII